MNVTATPRCRYGSLLHRVLQDVKGRWTTSAEIADRTLLDQQRVTEAVTLCLANGWMVVVGRGRRQGSPRIVAVTPKGEQLLKELEN